MQQHYQQIDVIKGLAILSVILLHSLQKSTLISTYSIYHIWQAVPVFMIIMGLNTGLATSATKKKFSDLYTRRYFRKRVDRILIPLLLTFAASVVAGLLWFWLKGEDKLEFNEYNIIGLLPVTGPGNYFITLLLQTVFFLPIIAYFFERHVTKTVTVLVVLEVLFLFLGSYMTLSDKQQYLYDAALPRYFSAIALGLVLSKVFIQPLSTVTFIFFLIVAVASGALLYLITYNDFDLPYVRPEWQAQNVFSVGYAAFVVLMLFRYLPDYSENLLLRAIATVGKASYHIFLVQVVYFGLIDIKTNVLQNFMICLPLGYLFYRLKIPLKL